MFKYIHRLSTVSKVLVIGALCCILVCIGIVCWYSHIDTALLDNISYYDKEEHFHYYYGLEKPISCIVYMVILSIILIILKLVVKYICYKKEITKKVRFIRLIVYILLYGILIYNLFNVEIGHIITSEEEFYVIDNLIIQSNFKEYSYSYFDDHFPQQLGKEVYFCGVENDGKNIGWKRDLLVGQYSDNLYHLLSELDYKTEYQYKLTSQFKVRNDNELFPCE